VRRAGSGGLRILVSATSHRRRRGHGAGLLKHFYKPVESIHAEIENTGGSTAISNPEVELGRDP
jgi:hypothetical protein